MKRVLSLPTCLWRHQLHISSSLLTAIWLIAGATVAFAIPVDEGSSISTNNEMIAQITVPPGTELPEQDPAPRAPDTLQELPPPEPLPSQDTLIPEVDLPIDSDPLVLPTDETQCIRDFQVVENTAFSANEINTAIEEAFQDAGIPERGQSADCPTGRRLSFSQVLIARNAINKLYNENKYITSGVIIPANTPLIDGVVVLQAVEGQIEDIQVNGLERLQSGYISSRLSIAAAPPINKDDLLDGIELLQLDPLIDTIRVDLQAGTTPGRNLLVVDVIEADTFDTTVGFNNTRSPSVGSFRREIELNENNLLGLGDSLSISYANTDGSNVTGANYTVPISPHNTTLTLAASVSDNNVIEEPFEVLEITSDSSAYNLTVQHPIIQTPEYQLDLGLTLSRQFSQTFLGLNDIGAFPLSSGANDEGRTVSSTARFYQAWTQRSTRQVLAGRSQFNLGLGGFWGGTINGDPALPDNNFFSWQGQGQWVRVIGSDSRLLLRSNIQLASESLLSAEQFGLGGQSTVRGYRQEELLTDNGIQTSAEVRFPIARVPDVDGVLRIAPFLDFGYGWNTNGNNPEDNTLLGIGSGLIWNQNNFEARLDFGIPLISVSTNKDSWQENGIYFSINYSFL